MIVYCLEPIKSIINNIKVQKITNARTHVEKLEHLGVVVDIHWKQHEDCSKIEVSMVVWM